MRAPARTDARVFLLFATSPVEREAVQRWAAEAGQAGGEGEPRVLAAGDAEAVESALAAVGTRAQVVPVGSTWVPSAESGRISGLAGLAGGVPGVGWGVGWLQRRVLDRDPERLRVIVGEAASVEALRRRWRRAGGEGARSFGDFVLRQARLALDRAERAVIGSRYKLPRRVTEEIAVSPRFQAAVAALAKQLGRPAAEVTAEALADLEEMMTRQTRLGVEFLDSLRATLLRSYESIEHDAAQLEALRRLNRRTSLVFLPSHRSYMDPLVLGAVLGQGGFPPNHVLGGINLSFWPVGPLARQAGIVFIRRSIRDDEVYKLALREYIGYLVEKRFNLEWYLEGGRSRTGKLRPPRYGLFAYLVEAFHAGRAEDVTLVPVSIVYDQLWEVSDMAAEARGAAKPRENLALLARYVRAQGRGFGSAHVRFGRPLSLRAALADAPRPELEVELTAIEVAHRINAVTPLAPTSLLTLALLGFGERALTLGELRQALDPLLEYVDRRGLPRSHPAVLATRAGVEETLADLMRHGVVRESPGGLEPLYGIGTDQHLVAAYYRNGAIHHFVNRAIAELAAAAAAESGDGDGRAAAQAVARRLRDLLKFEFFFGRADEFTAAMDAELADIEEEGRSARRPLHLADRVLGSFLEAYWVVVDRLAALDPSAAFEEAPFLAECLAAGRQYLLQRRISSPESITGELFSNALQLARNRQLLEGSDPEDLTERRQALAAELDGHRRRLARIRELALADLEEVA